MHFTDIILGLLLVMVVTLMGCATLVAIMATFHYVVYGIKVL